VSADIFVYAIIAAGLVLWLRNILGTRHGDERERPNPYLTPQDGSARAPVMAGLPGEEPVLAGPEDYIARFAADRNGVFSIENKTAEAGLLDILKSDRDFDIKHFFDGAQEAFAIIVEAFAAGDRDTLKDLLAPSVYESFARALQAREMNGEKQETEIHAVNKAEILAAHIKAKTAYITVRFTADETSVTRDRHGEITVGHPEKITKMRDVWVFGRALKSRDPRWLVYETRGDFDGDNDLIPDTIV
jgi:predicted lipid-binding transport protein (Tim44 family)